MREGISPVKEFDVTDVNAEMAAEKKKKEKTLGHGSKSEIKRTKDIAELSRAGKVLDEKKMAEARKKIQMAEGSGEVELSEEDIEEIEPEDLTNEAEEIS